MSFVAGSSFFIQSLTPGRFSWIHILSVVTIVTMTRGLIAIRRHDVVTHAISMSANHVGMLGALIGVIAVPTRLVPASFRADRAGMTAVTLVIAAAAFLGITAMAVAIRRLAARRPVATV